MKIYFIPLFLFSLVSFSLNGCHSKKVKYNTDYTQMAVTGMNNLIKNFWEEGEGIRPTWNGIHIPEEVYEETKDNRGQLWERSMMIFPMYHLYQLNNDPHLRSKLLFEAERLKSRYEESILIQPTHYYNTA